ncbi:MAG: helix-turn-helix domain-containing protein [Butyrivibrio sp.]|nr:helix-turn-helix domain-containing protein [Acetatifactor muris]MCM1558271.1 helix-turn-helix domain-containing protein [Butyrivibrio sp.]
MTTGAILARLRQERNIGQKEIAVFLKVSVSTVSNYENNVHSPDYAILCRLADYYDVTTDYLLGRTAYRSDPKVLNCCISDKYTVADIINLMLTFDSATVNRFMDYAKFLQTGL